MLEATKVLTDRTQNSERAERRIAGLLRSAQDQIHKAVADATDGGLRKLESSAEAMAGIKRLGADGCVAKVHLAALRDTTTPTDIWSTWCDRRFGKWPLVRMASSKVNCEKCQRASLSYSTEAGMSAGSSPNVTDASTYDGLRENFQAL